jgi:hypothetical protein
MQFEAVAQLGPVRVWAQNFAHVRVMHAMPLAFFTGEQ